MKQDHLKEAMQLIADALVDGIRAAMGVAGLDNSKLQESIEAKQTAPDTITAYMNEYGQWVVSGRRKFARKVPIAALLAWFEAKKIVPRSVNGKTMSLNRLAFAIQTSIYKKGIQGRDFISPALDDEFLKLAEKVLLEAMEREVMEALKEA